jgi:hypothetical protein
VNVGVGVDEHGGRVRTGTIRTFSQPRRGTERLRCAARLNP